MPKQDQGTDLIRYKVIPRTLIFITRHNQVLLLRGAANKRLWANRYNGIGGHVERNENILAAASRELYEEAGLDSIELHLCGIVSVDVEEMTGICLYVFTGESSQTQVLPSDEGQLEWISREEWDKLPLVEDLPQILPHVLAYRPGAAPFFARSYYDDRQRLIVDYSG